MKTRFVKRAVLLGALLLLLFGCGANVTGDSSSGGSSTPTYQVQIGSGGVVAKDASTGEEVDIIGGAVQGDTITLQK